MRVLGPERFKVHSLWDWDQSDTLVEALIRGRKGSLFQKSHEALAKALLARHLSCFDGVKNIVFPAKNTHKDHSWFLAEAVGQSLGVLAHPVWLIEADRYKLLGRKDRWRYRQAKPLRLEGPIVLIDDLWTTGATANALWQALDEPTHFRVCVLSYRRSSP